VSAATARAALTARLLVAIETRTGLSREAGLARRLERTLRTIDDTELRRLTLTVEPLPWEHPEWQSLIANVLVHETYFFRDWPQLDHLARVGLPPRIAAARSHAPHRLRIWSAGCASGEEPYSLAALTVHALALQGIAMEPREEARLSTDWQIEVTGTDLSNDMIEVARTARYIDRGLSPFRNMPDGFSRFFPMGESDERGVREDLRSAVTFRSGNLLAGPPPGRDFDVVVCRNVLVYFADAARRLAIEKLAGALAPGGFLLLGPTDPSPTDGSFEAIWATGAVIYRKLQ
jgi:chemotaxis protein methyltransferase CheR